MLVFVYFHHGSEQFLDDDFCQRPEISFGISLGKGFVVTLLFLVLDINGRQALEAQQPVQKSPGAAAVAIGERVNPHGSPKNAGG